MAAYAHNFVVSVIGPDNKPYRESNELGERTIRLDFGTEYKLRLRNKNKVRARVQVLIDGMDVSPGRQFILGPDTHFDLERFILNGDLYNGKRFRFKNAKEGAKTGEIQDPHNPSNGEIKVLFSQEDQISGMLAAMSNTPPPLTSPGFTFTTTKVNIPMEAKAASMPSTHMTSGYLHTYAANGRMVNCSTSGTFPFKSSQPDELPADLGATVEGSDSSQQFILSDEDFRVFAPIEIAIKLKGHTEERRYQYGHSTPKKTKSQAPPPPVPSEVCDWTVVNMLGEKLKDVLSLTIEFNPEKAHVEASIQFGNFSGQGSFARKNGAGLVGARFKVYKIKDNYIYLGDLA